MKQQGREGVRKEGRESRGGVGKSTEMKCYSGKISEASFALCFPHARAVQIKERKEETERGNLSGCAKKILHLA